jgi:hypothetical protein
LDIIEGESVSSKNINDKGVIEMTENIKVTANAFVIPNEAIAMGQQHVGVREYLKEFAKLNNIEIADSDKIISIWLTNPQSENLARYGFNVTVNDGILELSPYDLEYFPAKLLEGIKEGDTVKYLSPTKAFYNGNKGRDHIDVVLDVTITCQQKGYRFEASGNFEDAVVKVLNVCEPAKKEITVVTDIKKEKEEEKEEKVGIKMKISKTWNNLPNAAKTTIKVVGGTIAVAAVGFGAKVLYDHYNSDDEVAATSESKDIDVIDVEDDDAISITADDCEITVTTGDEI